MIVSFVVYDVVNRELINQQICSLVALSVVHLKGEGL